MHVKKLKDNMLLVKCGCRRCRGDKCKQYKCYSVYIGVPIAYGTFRRAISGPIGGFLGQHSMLYLAVLKYCVEVECGINQVLLGGPK